MLNDIFYLQELDVEDRDTMKQSLSLLEKTFNQPFFTEEWWKWKYIDSPFGKATGVCARLKEDGRIVALRVVWHWRFKDCNEIFSASQMIDTVTDRKYQRMGLFAELTRYALSKIGDDIIFNFPNSNSAPQNLKLGWMDLGNVPWLLCLSLPLRIKRGENILTNEGTLQTDWNEKFLNWRFKEHPINIYHLFKYNETLIIYRVDKKYYNKIATVMYVSNLTATAYSMFSKHLFLKGIFCFRYNNYIWNNLIIR